MRRLLCAVAVIAMMVPCRATAQSSRTRDRNDKNRTPQSQNTTQQRAQSQRTADDASGAHGSTDPDPYHESTRADAPRDDRPAVHARDAPRDDRSAEQAGYDLPDRSDQIPTLSHRKPADDVPPDLYDHVPLSERSPLSPLELGSILPRLFLSSSYYWSDWGALGLGPPPPGYVWVRYGPDLLLVNRYTGRIAGRDLRRLLLSAEG